MTTDTDDEGFTTVHQSAAFAGGIEDIPMRKDDDMLCKDCGLPTQICNARAMLSLAIERFGPARVGHDVYDLLLSSDGITDNVAAFELKNRYHPPQAAFAGAGAGGVVRPDLPLTLSAAQAEIVALRGRVAELEEALEIVRAAETIETPDPYKAICELSDLACRALTNGGDHDA